MFCHRSAISEVRCGVSDVTVMSVDDIRPTSVESADAGNSTAAAAASSLLTDHVASGDDHVTRVDRSTKPHTVHIREPPVSDTCQPTTFGQPTAVWSEQKHGPLHRAIPSMPLPLAIIACILNIILPGTGRHLLAYLLGRRQTHDNAYGASICNVPRGNNCAGVNLSQLEII